MWPGYVKGRCGRGGKEKKEQKMHRKYFLEGVVQKALLNLLQSDKDFVV